MHVDTISTYYHNVDFQLGLDLANAGYQPEEITKVTKKGKSKIKHRRSCLILEEGKTLNSHIIKLFKNETEHEKINLIPRNLHISKKEKKLNFIKITGELRAFKE